VFFVREEAKMMIGMEEMKQCRAEGKGMEENG
jgi:hypothetical protein